MEYRFETINRSGTKIQWCLSVKSSILVENWLAKKMTKAQDCLFSKFNETFYGEQGAG